MKLIINEYRVTVIRDDGTTYYQDMPDRVGELEESILRIISDLCKEPVKTSQLKSDPDDELLIEGGEP